jgi:hypothetical protein
MQGREVSLDHLMERKLQLTKKKSLCSGKAFVKIWPMKTSINQPETFGLRKVHHNTASQTVSLNSRDNGELGILCGWQ